MAQRIMLEGAALCRPFEQGDLDGLCGLYAVINAVALVAAPITPLSRARARALLHVGAEALLTQDEGPDILASGMSVETQVAVALHMLARAEEVTGVRLCATQLFAAPPSRKPPVSMTTLRDKLADGSALIVCLSKTLSHFTVLCGMTPSRAILFDSDGLRWLDRRTLGIGGKPRNCRHIIVARSVIEVRALPK